MKKALQRQIFAGLDLWEKRYRSGKGPSESSDGVSDSGPANSSSAGSPDGEGAGGADGAAGGAGGFGGYSGEAGHWGTIGCPLR